MSCLKKHFAKFDETDELHIVKRLKLDVGDLELSESKSKMTILNVIDDCLVEIFMYLTVTDLSNVSASNPRFKIPTETAFVRKHRKIPVTVSNIDTDGANGHMLESSVLLLQQFGNCIKKVYMKFKLENADRLLKAIVRYAGDTVVKLKFWHEKESWYMGLHRTGLRRIQREIRELKTKFPNLLHLKFEYHDFIDCPYSDDIIQAIPTLLHFSVTGVVFSHEDVNKFVRLNGQLESLNLWVPDGFVTQSFMTNLDASLPSLKSLKMNRVTIEGLLQPIHPHRFSNLKKLTYGGVCDHIPFDGLTSLFGENIEDLELYCYDYVIVDFVESICRFKKLTKLTYYLPPSVRGLTLETFDSSIVSSRTMRELVVRNNHLTIMEIDYHYDVSDYKILKSKYDVFRAESQGALWNLQKLQWIEDGYVRLIRTFMKFSKLKEN